MVERAALFFSNYIDSLDVNTTEVFDHDGVVFSPHAGNMNGYPLKLGFVMLSLVCGHSNLTCY